MYWEDELKHNITSLEQLREYIDMSPDEETEIAKVIEKHPMSITRYYLNLIKKSDTLSPVSRIVIPSREERDRFGSYDTSGEKLNTKFKGFQHKYPQTALILATNRCASYCRFCFRKRMVGLGNDEVLHRLDNAFDYITEHDEIDNVLITGGDPLMLPNNILREFVEKLLSIDHIDFIRFGTRIPVVLPSRIHGDREFLDLIDDYNSPSKRIYFVTHFNHPDEITGESSGAIAELIKRGSVVSNQTVLLKGVNDNPEVLAQLMKSLTRIGVVPYYIFQCRPVKYTRKRFQTTLKNGYEIVSKSNAMLNGHAKRFRYIISHKIGKIEILAIEGNTIYLKQHQFKDNRHADKFYRMRLPDNASWFDDLIPLK
ncbi:MAG: KamA family radical SAM protein [bacterium]